jgi:predicted deacylase
MKCLFCLLLFPLLACAQEGFRVGDAVARPGALASGFIEVAARQDEGARIPVTVIRGASSGPVLALLAGIHGYEYSPVLALQKLRGQIDPQRLAGTVIVVHVANPPSFLHRTIYYGPADGQNLNRVFPGKADGTLSERIAYALTKEVIERCDYLVDLHCGDGNESLRPYAYWMQVGQPKVDEMAREMVIAFGLDHIIIDTERPKDPAASVYASNTAATRGKPAITVESGGMGVIPGGYLVTDESITLLERGVKNVMAFLKMTGETPRYTAEHPVWIDRSEVLRSEHTGLWYPVVQKGHTVAAGALLGVVTDFFGKRLAEVRAPFDGEVLYIVYTPPINQGEPLAFIGHRKE